MVKDVERAVLEHIDKTDRCLIAGEPLWGDYSVGTYIRQLNAFSQPSSFDISHPGWSINW